MKRRCCRCARIMRWSHPTRGSMAGTCANTAHWDTCQQGSGTAFPVTWSIHTRTGALAGWLNTWGRKTWRRNILKVRKSYSYNYMFTRTTFDFAPGVAAAIVLFVIVVCQIAYRFSAMIIVAKGALKFLATRQNVKAP